MLVPEAGPGRPSRPEVLSLRSSRPLADFREGLRRASSRDHVALTHGYSGGSFDIIESGLHAPTGRAE